MSEPTTCFPFTLLEDLDVELSKQTQKHGLMPSDLFHCAVILTEECGESSYTHTASLGWHASLSSDSSWARAEC